VDQTVNIRLCCSDSPLTLMESLRKSRNKRSTNVYIFFLVSCSSISKLVCQYAKLWKLSYPLDHRLKNADNSHSKELSGTTIILPMTDPAGAGILTLTWLGFLWGSMAHHSSTVRIIFPKPHSFGRLGIIYSILTIMHNEGHGWGPYNLPRYIWI